MRLLRFVTAREVVKYLRVLKEREAMDSDGRPAPKFNVGDRIAVKFASSERETIIRAISWDSCWREWTYDLGGPLLICECALEAREARKIEPQTN